MSSTELDEIIWQKLLSEIAHETCVPFIGAGASCPPLPTATSLLEKLCGLFSVPSWATKDLSVAAEFIEIAYNRDALVRAVTEAFHEHPTPNDAHINLAKLPWHTIVTTNYDSYMSSALSVVGKYATVFPLPPLLAASSGQPLKKSTVKEPIVIHVHGSLDHSEIVITESDQYRYLANMASGIWALPWTTQSTLAYSSYLFVGYSLRDWTFRLLFYSLKQFIQRDHFALIFLPDEANVVDAKFMAEYLKKFVNAAIFFGNAQSFTTELRHRWEDFRKDQASAEQDGR
jgi:hypothetical protein